MQTIKTAFVLGAGLGTRLRPLTNSCPKPMLYVRGRPLIARIFDSLIEAGISRIIVSTHHAAGRYSEYFAQKNYKGAELVFIHEPDLLDTGGGLKNILPIVDKDEGIIVYNGDILFSGSIAEFLKNFEERGKEASLLLRSVGDIRNVGVKDGYVCDMRSILKADFEELMQFCGIFAGRGEFLEAFARRGEDVFSTVDAMVDFIRENPASIAAYVDDSAWSDIGTIEEYMRLK